ncbi:MAG: membrane lipoprotein lipid attachment site-containing protein [Candidatus Omnitrophica bacterium]|nr:membrane lipoprotein lipid attachment site-containing protein [Candidatus Omnitrophota bacterium]
MKRIIWLFLIVLILAGCATYRFQHGSPPYDKGYVASRDDYVILEYTLGKGTAVPEKIALAKARLQRRRRLVEHYYKKMGYIENHFKMVAWNPIIFSLKAIGGTFRLPCVAISDYKYEHNPKYREKIKKLEAEKDAREAARINKIKEELNAYIKEDLAQEGHPRQ